MNPGASIARQDLDQFFDECEPRVAISSVKHNAVNARPRVQPDELKRFFSDLDFRLEIQNKSKSQLDRHLASEFSVFEFIKPDENRLSDILKMLLDPRGAHGQQDLFLKLFLDRLGRTSEPNVRDTKVVREALTNKIGSFLRRIDILVTSDRLAMAIENKVDSGEQQDQLRDYHDHIQRLPPSVKMPSQSSHALIISVVSSSNCPVKIDSGLTLSIPRNHLRLILFQRHPLEHFDTLSVYIEPSHQASRENHKNKNCSETHDFTFHAPRCNCVILAFLQPYQIHQSINPQTHQSNPYGDTQRKNRSPSTTASRTA